MNKMTLILIALLMAVSANAAALDLQEAKAQGLVGETLSGYLSSPKSSPSSDVKKLIDDINKKRKAKYAEIAAQVGKPLNVVEKLAGEKAIEKTDAGHYIQTSDGMWIKK